MRRFNSRLHPRSLEPCRASALRHPVASSGNCAWPEMARVATLIVLPSLMVVLTPVNVFLYFCDSVKMRCRTVSFYVFVHLCIGMVV